MTGKKCKVLLLKEKERAEEKKRIRIITWSLAKRDLIHNNKFLKKSPEHLDQKKYIREYLPWGQERFDLKSSHWMFNS